MTLQQTVSNTVQLQQQRIAIGHVGEAQDDAQMISDRATLAQAHT